jgi:hypothetical protein
MHDKAARDKGYPEPEKEKKPFFSFASAEISHYKKMELTFFSPKLWNAWNHISKL